MEAIFSSVSRLLGPGDPAPDFTLPAVNAPGDVSLSGYRDRAPLLLGLFRGLHCPFCRRRLVQFATTQERLKAIGIETLAVVNTPLEPRGTTSSSSVAEASGSFAASPMH